MIATGKLLQETRGGELPHLLVRRRDWKMAQSTGAPSHMSWALARIFDIYGTQSDFGNAQDQAVRDFIVSLAPFADEDAKDPSLTRSR